MKEALILVAHADDESLGAGGLIQKLVKKDWTVKVVILSNGILDVRGKIEDNRPGAKAACKLLKIDEPLFMGFPDQKFDQVPMADLAGSVLSLNLNPDLIVGHVDSDLNLDHRIAHDVAKIVGRPKKKPTTILGCEIPNTSFWNGKAFAANFYVDITEEIDTK